MQRNSTSPLPVPAPPTRCHWSKLMAWPFLPWNSEYTLLCDDDYYYIFLLLAGWLAGYERQMQLKPKAFANCALPNTFQFKFIFLRFKGDKIRQNCYKLVAHRLRAECRMQTTVCDLRWASMMEVREQQNNNENINCDRQLNVSRNWAELGWMNRHRIL